MNNLFTSGYYDNVLFHRVIAGIMIQTGDPLGDGTVGKVYGGMNLKMKLYPAYVMIVPLQLVWPMPGQIQMVVNFLSPQYQLHGWMGNIRYLDVLSKVSGQSLDIALCFVVTMDYNNCLHSFPKSDFRNGCMYND